MLNTSYTSATFYGDRRGHWVADPCWPSPHISQQVFYLNSDRATNTLGETATASSDLEITGLLSHSFQCGEWGNFGSKGEFPPDQRAADGECLAFTSAPVEAATAILGNPEVELELAVDQPNALVGVRLCDVAPDGSSVLVSWGLLNLTHRNSHEQPEALEPGKRYQVRVQLRMAGYELAVGHRWRVGVSPTYTRHAWPSPQTVQLSLFAGKACRLLLPRRSPQAIDKSLPAFELAEISPPLAKEMLRNGQRSHTVTHDHVDNWTTLEQVNDEGRMCFLDHGLETDYYTRETFRVRDGDPLSTRQSIQNRFEFQRGDWRVRIETASLMTADATHFHLSNHLDAYEGETRVFSKSWTRAIPRHRV